MTISVADVLRPRYILWISGGRALVDGEWLALSDIEECLIYNDDCLWSFNLAVESPQKAIAIAKRITGCRGLGLVELEDDGVYHEWYDADGNDLLDVVYEELMRAEPPIEKR
jgi:hypothetical protein